MLTSFQRRKLTRYFNCLDQDGKGFFTRDDIVAVARRLADEHGIDKTSASFEEIKKGILTIWDNARVYGYGQNPNQVSLSDWLIHESIILSTKEMREAYMEKITREVFDIADIEQKGYINKAEFASLMRAFGVEDEIPEWSFDQITESDTKVIKRNEFVKIVEDFHISEDRHAPGNYLFGPY